MTATTPVKAPPGASRTRYLILGLAFVGLSLNYLDALTYAFVAGRAEPLPVLDRTPATR